MRHTIEMMEQALLERARWRERGVALPTPGQIISAHVGEDFHYISFTSIEKLGVNPSTTYATPIGIYAYPLGDPWFERAWEATSGSRAGGIPFAVDQPYIQLFQAKNESRVIVIGQDGDILRGASLVDRAMRRIVDEYDSDELERVEKLIAERYELRSQMSRLWLTTMILAQLQRYADKDRTTRALKYDNQHVVRWSKMLVDLGIEGVEDRGSGTIHPNEPHQAVFFNKRAVEPISMLSNPLPAARAKRDYLIKSKKQLGELRFMLKSFTQSYDRFTARATLNSETDSSNLMGYLGESGDRYTLEEFIAKHGVPIDNTLPHLDDVQSSLASMSTSLERLIMDHDRSAFVRQVMFNTKSMLGYDATSGAQPIMSVRVGSAPLVGASLANAADFDRRLSGWSWRTTLGARSKLVQDCTLDLRVLPISNTEGLVKQQLRFQMEGGELRAPKALVTSWQDAGALVDQDGAINADVLKQRELLISQASQAINNKTILTSFSGFFATEDEAASLDSNLRPVIVRFV